MALIMTSSPFLFLPLPLISINEHSPVSIERERVSKFVQRRIIICDLLAKSKHTHHPVRRRGSAKAAKIVEHPKSSQWSAQMQMHSTLRASRKHWKSVSRALRVIGREMDIKSIEKTSREHREHCESLEFTSCLDCLLFGFMLIA